MYILVQVSPWVVENLIAQKLKESFLYFESIKIGAGHW